MLEKFSKNASITLLLVKYIVMFSCYGYTDFYINKPYNMFFYKTNMLIFMIKFAKILKSLVSSRCISTYVYFMFIIINCIQILQKIIKIILIPLWMLYYLWFFITVNNAK